MPYRPEKPHLAPSPEALRARIPGWGVDLDPKDRPAVPRERFEPHATGAHWELPEQQPEKWPRERSIEHTRLTPVFGTACPPKGASGAIRRLAYRRYSEGQAMHWLLLMAADRVDTVESTARSLGTFHPDDPITETGVLSEFRHHGIRSRLGHGRADVKHQWMDPLIVGAPWAAAAAAVYTGARAARARLRRRRRAGGT